MQAIQPHIMWPKLVQAYQLNTLQMNGTTTKVSYITIYPYTDTLNKVIVRTRLVSVAQPLKVSLQGIGTDGKPDGSIIGGGQAYGTIASPASATSYSVALTGPVAVSIGVPVAIVVEWDSTAGNLSMASGAGEVCNNFYTATYASGAWAIVSPGEVPLVGFEYASGYHGGSTWPLYNIAATTFNVNSSPNEIGIYTNMPSSIDAQGGAPYVNLQGAADLILYDANTEVKAVVSMNPNNRWNAAMAFHYMYFATVPLLAGQAYRLTLKPTTATDVLLMEYTLPAAIPGIMNSLSLGDKVYRTSRTGAGAWTEVDYMRPVMALFAGGFEEGGRPRGIMTPAGGHSIYR